MPDNDAPPGARPDVAANAVPAGVGRRFAGVRHVDLERVRARIPRPQIAAARNVLLALAELHVSNFDEEREQRNPGYVRASVDEVAEHAGLTARTVYRVLPLLVAEGLVEYRPGRGTRPSTWRIRPIPKPPGATASPDMGAARPTSASPDTAPASPDTTSGLPVRGTIWKEGTTSSVLSSSEDLARVREEPPSPRAEEGRTRAFTEGKGKSIPPGLVVIFERLGGTPPTKPADLAALVAAYEAAPLVVEAIADHAAEDESIDSPAGALVVRIRLRWHEQARWRSAGEREARRRLREEREARFWADKPSSAFAAAFRGLAAPRSDAPPPSSPVLIPYVAPPPLPAASPRDLAVDAVDLADRWRRDPEARDLPDDELADRVAEYLAADVPDDEQRRAVAAIATRQGDGYPPGHRIDLIVHALAEHDNAVMPPP